MIAGTDTTSITLTYLFYELAIQPEWQDRIRKELGNIKGIPQWKTISGLEILDAIVKEALRLHSSAPASLWREVPEGGMIIAGHFIPQYVRTLIPLLRLIAT